MKNNKKYYLSMDNLDIIMWLSMSTIVYSIILVFNFSILFNIFGLLIYPLYLIPFIKK